MTEKIAPTLEERARRAIEEAANRRAQAHAEKLRTALGKIGLNGQIKINLRGEDAYCDYEDWRFVLWPYTVGTNRPMLALEYKVGYSVRLSDGFDSLNGFHDALIEARLAERAPTWYEKGWHDIKLWFLRWWHGR